MAASEKDIAFKVYSKNHNGTSDDYSTVLVQNSKNQWTPIDVKSISYKTYASLSWNHPTNVKDIVGYTVFSCRRPKNGKYDDCDVSI